MAINKRRPQTPSGRFQSYLSSKDITTKTPERSLVVGMRKTGGRNSYGRITTRHRGGGADRKYRIIDFKRLERDIPGKITTIEYDPNRNVRIGLVVYDNGAKRYMLLPEGLGVGSSVIAGVDVEARPGNSMPLEKIPLGFFVHNVESAPNSGGTFARSAGTAVQIKSKSNGLATVLMPSGELRLIPLASWATVGSLGNADFQNITWGKAGRTRNKGFRPSVRGMAMNPVDHPHGGGEGRSKSGSHPVTPWGKGRKGTRTRKRKNPMILRRRK